MHTLPFKRVVDAIAVLRHTFTVQAKAIDPNAKTNDKIELNPVDYIAYRKATSKRILRGNRNPLGEAAICLKEDFRRILKTLDDALPKIRAVCLACSHSSDDDILSHLEQTFICLDAMTIQCLLDFAERTFASVDEMTF